MEKYKKILSDGEKSIGLGVFYRHYWNVYYGKSSQAALYDNFKEKLKRESYAEFLTEMLESAKLYMRIVNPQREHYQNRKEYFWLVQSLKELSNNMGIVQVRMALFALLKAKEKKLLSASKLKDTILYLEHFHYAYNAIMTERTNRLDSIYSNFAYKLNSCKCKKDANDIITTLLLNKLDPLYPSYNKFEERFIALIYTKKEHPSNIKTKYAINKLNCFYEKTDINDDEGSIEHIFPESEGEESLNIGNLILLETSINENAGKKKYEEKKDQFYINSKYKWIKEFCKNNKNWNSTRFENRAKEMATIFYTKILKRNIV